ncbi:uncharacterized protein VTP21DRAFT_8775 [Calcarisporiella thermophila]|uniref:uncharacterized protein n=1 Tax=Calcarisporiella thermophila TaxID=911321 RepID=UPI003742BF9B
MRPPTKPKPPFALSLRQRTFLFFVVSLIAAGFVILHAIAYTSEYFKAKRLREWMDGVVGEVESLWGRGDGPASDWEMYTCGNTPMHMDLVRALVLDSLDDEVKLSSSEVEERQRVTPTQARVYAAKEGPVTLKSGQPFCVRVVLPPLEEGAWELNDTNRELYTPLPGYGWDSLLMAAVDFSKENLTVALKPKQWHGHTVLHRLVREKEALHNPSLADAARADGVERLPHEAVKRGGIHVYEAEVRLLDPGTYQIFTRWEYRDGRWNYDTAPLVPYIPVELPSPDGLRLRVVDEDEKPKERKDDVELEGELTLEGMHAKEVSYTNHFDLPLCTSHGDHPGRWLHISQFNTSDPKVQPSAVDSAGFFWAPYTCRYRKVTYQEFSQCLAQKYPRVHWFGDSNSRRSLKKIVTKGEWCKDGGGDDEQRARECACEDYTQADWDYSLFNPGERINNLTIVGDEHNTTRSLVEYYKWDGLSNFNDPAWEEIFNEFPNVAELKKQIPDLKVVPEFDPESPSGSKQGRAHHAKRWFLSAQPPSLVIISLGNWDAAFLPYNEFVDRFNRLVAFLRQRYQPYGVPIVYRSSQYFCCRADNTAWQRRFSTLRLDAYDRLMRDTLKSELGAQIWNVFEMGEEMPMERKMANADCPSNHAPVDVVEAENQVLFNMLCNA